MRIYRLILLAVLSFLATTILGSSPIYALKEYDLGERPDRTLVDAIDLKFRSIPESEINTIELSQRPDPININEIRQFLTDLERECFQEASLYQLRNTETRIKTKLNLFKQLSQIEPLATKLETQVTVFTSLCVNQSEFNRELQKINAIINNSDQIKRYIALSDKTLTCNTELAESINSDYSTYTKSYNSLKTYNDSIISGYNQLVIDDKALSESSAELSQRNSDVGQDTSKVIENLKLIDLKLKTTLAEKNKAYEELRTSYEKLTEKRILNLEEVNQEFSSSENSLALSLDEGENWMLTNDIDELFRYFSLLKNNPDQVNEIKNTISTYAQKSEDIKSTLAQKLALNLILEVYSLETVRNNSEISSNNERRQNIADVSQTHRLLAEERKELDRELLNTSSILHKALENCSTESENEFNKYKNQYEALNSDFKKYIDDKFKTTLSQKELAVMTDAKSASATEPQLVFTVAKKLSDIINQLSVCSNKETLNILLSTEPISTVTVSGISGINFQVEGNADLSKNLNDIQSLSEKEMLFNGIDINNYISNLNTKINDMYQQQPLGTQTIILSPVNPWSQDIYTTKETYVTYNCSDKQWVRANENSSIKVENGTCKNLVIPSISIIDAENKTFIPDLIKTNIDNLILERQFKQFGICQTN